MENVIKEIKRLQAEILGISYTKLPDQGKSITPYDYVLYYSRGDKPTERYGLGILLTKEIFKSVTNFVSLSNHCHADQIEAKPYNINIVQVYAPTRDRPVTK